MATTPEELSKLWLAVSVEEFSAQVVPCNQHQLDQHLKVRSECGCPPLYNPPTCCKEDGRALPLTIDDWQDVLNQRIAKSKKGKQTGTDFVPYGLIRASGQNAVKALAFLMQQVQQEGPPMPWRGSPVWAAPRKHTLPLTLANSRALMCANHIANFYAGVLRSKAAPYQPRAAGDQQASAIKRGGTALPMFIAKHVSPTCKKK